VGKGHYQTIIHTKANNIMSFKKVTPEEQHEDEILQNPKIHLSMRSDYLPSSASEAAELYISKMSQNIPVTLNTGNFTTKHSLQDPRIHIDTFI
jgi:hypothetical protein